MQVAIRELKANLSRILSRARAGEPIEVTSHNKPIARIIGIPAGTGEGLREAIARGALSWNGGKPRLAAPVELTTPGTPVSTGPGGPRLILFCDTCALIKLYIHGDFTDSMLTAAEAAAAIAVCQIAQAEAMAALARRLRACPADTVAIETARRRLGHDWRDYAIIEVTQALVEQAGDYADTFALRGYDSVQLAAARTLYEPGHEPVLFACFDRRLQIAARVLGLGSVHLPDLPG